MDQIEPYVPAAIFLKKVDILTEPEVPWEIRDLAMRIACLFSASIASLLTCCAYAVATAVAAVLVPIKFPFFVAFLIFNENEFLRNFYDRVPGITSMVRFAYKAAMYALTSIISSVAGVLKPKWLIDIHSSLQLITFDAKPIQKS